MAPIGICLNIGQLESKVQGHGAEGEGKREGEGSLLFGKKEDFPYLQPNPLPRKRPSMTLLLIAYLGGVLTILSPCILPVLPFVFARTGRPFARSILPMLLGMVATFAAVASLAAVGGS